MNGGIRQEYLIASIIVRSATGLGFQEPWRDALDLDESSDTRKPRGFRTGAHFLTST
jgi:hypothetical protein